MDFLRQLFGSGDFHPHGFCYMWNPALVRLHAFSDGLIALAYFTIPITLRSLARKRADLPFPWMFFLFGTFIVACGATHLLEVWNLWHADYWLAGAVKAVTAVASVGTAILLVPLVPHIVDLPSPQEWIKAHSELQHEIRERRDLEINLRLSEATYREQAELLDLAHDAIFVCGLDSKIIYWNLAAERLYGWNREEARGKITHELLKTQFPKSRDEIQADLFRNNSWEGELIHSRRDGRQIVVSSRWALRTDSAGNPVSILESNRDITHRKNEEEKFRNLLESAPDAVVIVNGSGRIHLVNKQTEKLFGYPRQELIDQPVEILLPERFHDRHMADRSRYASSPHARPMGAGLELLGRRKDATEFPVEVSLSPLESGEGTLISSAIRDVTDRNRAEEALRDTESRLSLALDSVKIGAWDWDLTTDSSIRTLRHDEIFGFSSLRPEWGKEIFLTHVFPEDLESVNLCIAESLKTGTLTLECRVVWPDHSIHWVSIQGRVYRAENGVPTRMRGVIADVTPRKLAEQALEKNRIELARSNAILPSLNKELETFSYSVSHDLRAPLRHVDGFARILKEEHAAELSEEANRYLDRIILSANHMGHLVDGLLKLARIGRKEMVRKKVNLNDLVRQALEDLPKDKDYRDVEWRIEPLPEMDCDPGLLELVFSNLLANAFKFTRHCQPAVIEVGTRLIDGVTAVFVRDNGVGFDPQYADKLFGVFQRLHRQEDFEGTGVGLATVQRIIHRHGGEVWADSRPGEGATFFFTLAPRPSQPGAMSVLEPQHERI